MIEINKIMSTILYSKKLAVSVGVRLYGQFDMQVRSRVSPNSVLRSGLMGTFSFALDDCELQNCMIGRYCSIDRNVSFALDDYQSDWLTSSPILSNLLFAEFSDDLPPYEHEHSEQIHVGHDVRIGRGVTIMPGVRIGTGAVICPNSVVKLNVEPYSICAGVPARHETYRFSRGVIDILLDTPWFNYDIPKWNNLGTMPNLRDMNESTARMLRKAVQSGEAPLLKEKTYRFSEAAGGSLRLSKIIP